jgi:type IV pilus assembly protein PilY1
VIDTYDTTAGSTATPSGLAKFSGYSETSGTNLVGYIYGGDLLGNMWRFDINSPASSSNPFLFATVQDALGNSQPITVAPELGKINNKWVIYFGTGKYLETADLSNTQRQSFYAIQDDDATTTFINPRTSLVQQTLSLVTGYTSLRTSTTNPVDFSTGRGWFVDLPDTGERVNLEAKLISQVLIVASLVPSNTACSPGGYGWLNYFDYATGQAVGPVVTSGTNKVASQKTDGTIVGLNEIYIGGTPMILYVTNRDPTPKKPAVQPVFPVGNNGSFQNKRQMWREIY